MSPGEEIQAKRLRLLNEFKRIPAAVSHLAKEIRGTFPVGDDLGIYEGCFRGAAWRLVLDAHLNLEKLLNPARERWDEFLATSNLHAKLPPLPDEQKRGKGTGGCASRL